MKPQDSPCDLPSSLPSNLPSNRPSILPFSSNFSSALHIFTVPPFCSDFIASLINFCDSVMQPITMANSDDIFFSLYISVILSQK